MLFSFTEEALTTDKDALKVKLKSVVDVVSAPVVVVGVGVGVVVVVEVVVEVCVSSRHEMRHSAPLAVPFLSDTNLNHLIEYQRADKNILTLILASFLL